MARLLRDLAGKQVGFIRILAGMEDFLLENIQTKLIITRILMFTFLSVEQMYRLTMLYHWTGECPHEMCGGCGEG